MCWTCWAIVLIIATLLNTNTQIGRYAWHTQDTNIHRLTVEITVINNYFYSLMGNFVVHRVTFYVLLCIAKRQYIQCTYLVKTNYYPLWSGAKYLISKAHNCKVHTATQHTQLYPVNTCINIDACDSVYRGFVYTVSCNV